jgi:hypothetical protein
MPGAFAGFWPSAGGRPWAACGGGRASELRYLPFGLIRPAIKISLKSKYYVQTILPFFLFENILHIVAVAFYHLY